MEKLKKITGGGKKHPLMIKFRVALVIARVQTFYFAAFADYGTERAAVIRDEASLLTEPSYDKLWHSTHVSRTYCS